MKKFVALIVFIACGVFAQDYIPFEWENATTNSTLTNQLYGPVNGYIDYVWVTMDDADATGAVHIVALTNRYIAEANILNVSVTGGKTRYIPRIYPETTNGTAITGASLVCIPLVDQTLQVGVKGLNKTNVTVNVVVGRKTK